MQLHTSPVVSAARANWVDAARGIGIILVVYGHALRGLFPAAAHRPAWAAAQDAVIYRFHMPLFFILAGLWVWPSLARGRGAFFRNKVVTILYPYFLWSLIEGLMELIFARYANTPIALGDLAWIPIVPIEQFWFLYALFFGQLILLALYPRRYLLPFAAVVMVVPFGSASVAEICMAVVYLSAGSLAAAPLKAFAARSPAIVFGIGASAWIAFAVSLGASPMAPAWASALVCALFGSIGTIAIAILLHRAGWSGLLKVLGRGSMAIYLMHTIASAGARVMLARVGSPLPAGWTLVIITAVGLAAPMVVWWLAARWRIAQWLGLPSLASPGDAGTQKARRV